MRGELHTSYESRALRFGSRGLIARSRLGRALKGLHGRPYRVVKVFRPRSRRERLLRAREQTRVELRNWNLVTVSAFHVGQVPARGVGQVALREARQQISPLTAVVIVPPIGIEVAILIAVRLRVVYSRTTTNSHPSARHLLTPAELQENRCGTFLVTGGPQHRLESGHRIGKRLEQHGVASSCR